MVTYEIKTESTEKPEKPDEPHLKLYLENTHGKITIRCEEVGDEDGDGWYIGSFTKEGYLELEPDIGETTGLKLDTDGRIQITHVEDQKWNLILT